jgi:ABC-type transport system involved in multi-copper enzyme maturation permease subunit
MSDLRAALGGILGNPVASREAKVRARSASTPLAISLFLGAVAAVASLLFAVAAVGSPDHAPGAGQLERVAYHTMAFQIAIAALVAPALGASQISGERARGTLDSLLGGVFTARSVVLAKLAGSLAYLLLFLLAALPLHLVVFLHAGLGLGQLAVGELLTLVTACAGVALGLFLSAILSRTSAATLAGCSLALALLLDVVLSGVVPAPGSGLPQTASQLVASSQGRDTTDLLTDAQGRPLPAGRDRVAPLRLASPLYALHKSVADPAPEVDPDGIPVARVVRSFVPGDSSWSTWGPRLRPWQYSVGGGLLASFLLVAGATAQVRLPRRRTAQRLAGWHRPAHRGARTAKD